MGKSENRNGTAGKKTSLLKKAGYWMNENISKGVKQQFIMLLAFICLVIVVFGVLALAFRAVDEAKEGFWQSFIHLLDPGTVSGNDFSNTPLLVLMVIVTLIGMAFTGLLISIINNALEDKLVTLRRGITPVVEEDHMVIIGCNQSTYTVLREQITANENLGKTAVIVVADEADKEDMEREIHAHISNFYNTKLICRSGNIKHSDFYAKLALEKALSIMVCLDDDSEMLRVFLAVGNYLRQCGTTRPRITAQMSNPHVLYAARTALADFQAKLFYCEDVLSRITAQVCRQPGLSYVLYDLFNYEDAEIYIEGTTAEGKTLDFSGKKFRDVIGEFANCTAIGVRRWNEATQQKEIVIDPVPDFPMQSGDEIVHIAEDDRMIVLEKPRYSAAIQEVRKPFLPMKAEKMKLLILDWNHKVPTVLKYLDNFVAAGSLAKIVVTEPAEMDVRLENIAIEFLISDKMEEPACLESLIDEDLTNILLVCSDRTDEVSADTNTMIRLLHLREIIEAKEHASGRKSKIIFTSELRDPENQRLMDIAKVNDFIIGSEFTNRVITQIANEPDLECIFKELLTAEGAEIYLRPAEAYIDITKGHAVSFADLTQICYENRDIAIGWMIYNEEGHIQSKVNPEKAATHCFLPGEEIIVISQGT